MVEGGEKGRDNKRKIGKGRERKRRMREERKGRKQGWEEVPREMDKEPAI